VVTRDKVLFKKTSDNVSALCLKEGNMTTAYRSVNNVDKVHPKLTPIPNGLRRPREYI